MAITLIFGASMNSQETFTDDHQQILSDIYRKDAQAKKRNEKIDLVLRNLNLDSKFIIQLPLSRLATLELSNCQLDDEAITCLMKEIQQIPDLPLRALDLSSNTFGLEGAKELAKTLPKLTNLQELYLASNDGLNDLAVCKIVESLIAEGSKVKSLKHFDLSFLKISNNKTANAIANTIAQLSVKNLGLNGHMFKKDFEIIADASSKKNTQLAATTVFTPENSESSEHSEYKKNLKIVLAGYDKLALCAKQRSQVPDTSPNNESGNFPPIAQNC